MLAYTLRLRGPVKMTAPSPDNKARLPIVARLDSRETLRAAMRITQRKAFVGLNGTLVPIDRLSGASDWLYHSGKRPSARVNIQFLTDPRTAS
ncbi:hypothetical protein [Actinomadura luteofluorescens]|uniref:hypothetical protein n=1 Tax=Actinomadura luteofluorescens TaxID=46163 RepID=UPI002164070B|nr:hypothetical protein [Actinomadura glauciflava]